MQNQEKPRARRPRRLFSALMSGIIALALMAAVAPSAAAHDRTVEREDVLTQGGGDVYAEDGAKLVRTDERLKVKWRIPTPTPGSYDYPLPTMVPPGAPIHPPIQPGHPEVFTLWAFVFNAPELCNGPCDGDDIGNTPAQGGVYQLDSVIADRGRIKMKGRIKVGQTPVAGVPLQDPMEAEVHIAMAPHGMALTGAELQHQLNSAVGTPAHWFPALFIDD